MHLGISVPGVWYRAVLRWTQPDGRERMLAGVTVPGAPTVITGSNGDVAWGFTNAMLDTSDLIDLRLDPAKPGQYLTPDGWQPFAIHDEPIQVAHAPTLPHRVTNTVWGPVLGAAPSGAIHAVAWVMARPEALAANSLALENATNVAQAIHAAHRSARPVQNFVAGDRSGAIAWTLVGTLPDRDAGTGEFAEDWSQPKAPWRGLLPAERRPVVMNPEGGRIWTANQRILGSPAYLALGDGGWDLGARASCIRDRLTALQKATPADMLAIQLDDTIPMLRPWHRRLVAVASSLASKAHPTNAVAWSNLLAQLRPWDGRAAADSLAVPAIARFRHHAINLLYEPIGWALGEANSMDSARPSILPFPVLPRDAIRGRRRAPPGASAPTPSQPTSRFLRRPPCRGRAAGPHGRPGRPTRAASPLGHDQPDAVPSSTQRRAARLAGAVAGPAI
jgi:penicillin amidase